MERWLGRGGPWRANFDWKALALARRFGGRTAAGCSTPSTIVAGGCLPLCRRRPPGPGWAAGEGQELRHSRFNALRQHFQVWYRVVVTGDAKVEAAEVGEDRDRDPYGPRDRDVGIRVQHLSAPRVQRELRSRHIGRDGLDQTLLEAGGEPCAD